MKGKSIATFVGSIASAILASICCIGPLILAGLGIGSIGVFSSPEKAPALVYNYNFCIYWGGILFCLS